MKAKYLISLALVILFSLTSLTANAESPSNLLTFQIIQSEINFNHPDIKSAEVIKQADNRYGIKIKLNAQASEQLKQMTKANIGKISHLVFNGKIISTATIQSELEGDFILVGFTNQEANTVVKAMNAHHI